MPLYNIHSLEVLKLRLYDHAGKLRPEALRRFTRFMRYSRTGEGVPVHWRVPVLLYDVWLHFGQPQVTVFSGYRPRETCELKTSKHIHGKAVDFRLDGIRNAAVRDYLLRYGFMVGVGYYPNSYHVHMDVRGKKGFWVDYSRPGEPAIYATHPYRDLKKGLALKGYRPPEDRGNRKRPDGGAPAEERRLLAGSEPAAPPQLPVTPERDRQPVPKASPANPPLTPGPSSAPRTVGSRPAAVPRAKRAAGRPMPTAKGGGAKPAGKTAAARGAPRT